MELGFFQKCSLDCWKLIAAFWAFETLVFAFQFVHFVVPAKCASDISVPTWLCQVILAFLLVRKVFCKLGQVLEFHILVCFNITKMWEILGLNKCLNVKVCWFGRKCVGLYPIRSQYGIKRLDKDSNSRPQWNLAIETPQNTITYKFENGQLATSDDKN